MSSQIETLIAESIARTRAADNKAALAGRAMTFGRFDEYYAAEQKQLDKDIEAMYGDGPTGGTGGTDTAPSVTTGAGDRSGESGNYAGVATPRAD